MNKKEVYEHLANIYLDASSKSSKKKRELSAYFKMLPAVTIVGLVIVIGLGGLANFSRNQNHNQPGQIALFLYQDTTKINFNFDPAVKESFLLNLKHLDLSQYKALAFSIRKTNPTDVISLRVEFTNHFNEKSEIYIKNIENKWAGQKLDFKLFAKINDWTQMRELAFSIEEWNAREKTGIIYLDNIRVLK
ncbi:MAG: hypothetical protein V1670_02120 [Candidatus Omnitrophota bacterium]